MLDRFAKSLRDLGVLIERAERSDHSKSRQFTLRWAKAAKQRAEQAGQAACAGATSGSHARIDDDPEQAADAPQSGRNEPRQAAPSQGDGACGASGASNPDPAESTDDDHDDDPEGFVAIGGAP